MAAAKKTTAATQRSAGASSSKGSRASSGGVKKAATATTAATKKTTAAKKTTAKRTAQGAAAKKAPAKKAPPQKAGTATKKTAAARAGGRTTANRTTTNRTRGTRGSTLDNASATKKSTAGATTTRRSSGSTGASGKRAGGSRSGGAARSRAGAGTPAMLTNDRPDRLDIPKPRGKSKDGISYTKDFDVRFLKAQRDELLQRRQSELARATRLEDEATSLIEDGEMGDVQFDDEGGEGDTMVVQRDLDRVLSSQARQTIADIDAALRRIEEGTYGYSEISGQPIPRERLEAIPETTVLAAEKVSGIGGR
jgi:RNA polymerase-binding transcription factor DksA